MFATITYKDLDKALKPILTMVIFDMSVGLKDLGEDTVKAVSLGIPPPKGAWRSCCHLATGVMNKAPVSSNSVRLSGTTLKLEFGMSALSASAPYHWAHEMGYKPHGTRPKLYFQKGVTKQSKKVSRKPSAYFRRNSGYA